MYLNDLQIKRLIQFERLTDPKWIPLINPASLDVTVGENALLLLPNDDPLFNTYLATKDDVGNQFEGGCLGPDSTLKPGGCMLLETEQVFKFPNNVCGMIRLKSTCGRQFYEHLEAGWIDPGYEGRLTLEIINHSYIDLPLYPGMRIAQIVFGWVEPPEQLYQGRYQGDKTVQIAKEGK